MDISCDIIRDLLPLYAEDLVSEDSRKLVDGHLCSCDPCTKQLGILKKAAQKAEKRKPEVSEITLADLTKAITAKIDEKEENSERIREILNEDFHTEKVRELPKESYSAFLKAVEAL